MLSALDGAQMDLKASLPQSQLQLLDSRQQQLVAMTNFFNSCVTVTDVTLAIDIDDMMHEVHLNAPMKSQFKQLNTPVAGSLKVIRIFHLVHESADCRLSRW